MLFSQEKRIGTFEIFLVKAIKGYRIYVDIMIEKKLSSIQVANMDINYWSVSSSSRRGGDGIKEV